MCIQSCADSARVSPELQFLVRAQIVSTTTTRREGRSVDSEAVTIVTTDSASPSLAPFLPRFPFAYRARLTWLPLSALPLAVQEKDNGGPTGSQGTT